MFEDKAPELHVPASALQRPAGAIVDPDGTVACVTCGSRVAMASADIVGQGYRCVPCTRAAQLAALQGKGDAASHLDADERAGVVAAGNRLLASAALGAIAAVVVAFAGGDRGPEIGIGLGASAIVVAALGLHRRRAAD